MKKETAQDKLEGVLVKVGQQPITEHYTAVSEATAEALADEIARRACRLLNDTSTDREVRIAAERTLLDWFTGDWKPGGKP